VYGVWYVSAYKYKYKYKCSVCGEMGPDCGWEVRIVNK
jgi:predicted small metal-binding protein